MHTLIRSQFAFDSSFQQFYTRFSISKKVMIVLGTCLSCGVLLIVYELLHLSEEAISLSCLFPLSILFTLYFAFELLMVLLPWLSLRSRQQIWMRLSGDELYLGDPFVKVTIEGNHATVVVDHFRDATNLQTSRVIDKKRIKAMKYYFQDYPPLANTYPLDEMTEAVWGKDMALILMGGWSRCPITWGRGGYARRIRVTPALPIGLAQMQEADRKRLRLTLEKRGIPIREVHDEGWARRALRALKSRLGRGT